MHTIYILLTGVLLLVVLLYQGRGFLAFSSILAAFLVALYVAVGATSLFFVAVLIVAVLVSLFGCPYIRRAVVSAPLLKMVGKILPTMGDTERAALEAGSVWWDGELFSGDPDWKKLLDFKPRELTERERAFIDGPTEKLCAMIDDWQVAQDRDFSKKVWNFIKRERFFGMIIPEEYGGLGFSAIAHSQVITKISSHSVSAAVTIMVPNSLGPGELLLHYGTDEQKDHYLPRLASGKEVPCFALTGPEAGSDAASTKSTGIVCRAKFKGKNVVGIRLNFAKRYITLAPVATVVGLAFKLFDPDGLLGGKVERGITCALLPPGLKGIEIGDHHDPMGVPFQNGPIFGKDVFIPLSFVIGGEDGIGNGWRMLMESLAAGRSISLPSLSVGAAQLAARVVGAYGTVREQFNMPVGRFEGVEEPMARIGGYAYLMNATRILTCAAVDAGEKPAVLSAIAKAYLTEGMRGCVNDAFDIRAGAAICRGPNNILGRGYIGVPIAITVEGANILTRSLIIYGQGAIRCHPFVHDEMEAVADSDLGRFDKAFFGHIGFVSKNAVRAFLIALTGARFITPPCAGVEAAYFCQLSRFSAAFSLISDGAMATLGGSLKRREKITGRMADALAWMYLASCTLKKFHDDGRPDRDLALLHWSCTLALFRIEEALVGVLDNFPNRLVAWVLKRLAFPLGRSMKLPSDEMGGLIAKGLMYDGEMRLNLTSDIYIPAAGENGLGRLEEALEKIVDAAPARNKVRDAVRSGGLGKKPDETLFDRARNKGIISENERQALELASLARDKVIQVDVFDHETYIALKG